MADETTTLRRCIGSARFGIEAHEAPISEFPAQPSQKDGLGRMCKVHWNAYTAGLARDAKARKAAVEAGDEAAVSGGAGPVERDPTQPEPATKRARRVLTPEPGAQGDAG